MERGDIYPFCQDIGVFHEPWLFGFVDDDRAHQGTFIHSPRVPQEKHGPKLYLADIKVLHYQYTDWTRMKSKHRRYEVIETLHDSRRGAISIYRQYHHMDPPNPWRMPIPREWLDGYIRAGIDMTSANIEEFLAEPGVDGALIGGASLKPDEMAGICARAGITAKARGLAS